MHRNIKENGRVKIKQKSKGKKQRENGYYPNMANLWSFFF